jgi:hypothetical protein
LKFSTGTKIDKIVDAVRSDHTAAVAHGPRSFRARATGDPGFCPIEAGRAYELNFRSICAIGESRFASKFVNRGFIRVDEILRTLDYPGLVDAYAMGLPSSSCEPILVLLKWMDGPLAVAKLDGTLKLIVLMFIAKSSGSAGTSI